MYLTGLIVLLLLAAQPTGTYSLSECILETESTCDDLTQSQTCLDLNLNYKHTKFVTRKTFSDVQSTLKRLEGLRKVPPCWRAIQTILCTSLIPKCNGNGTITLPTYDMCRGSRAHCSFIDLHFEWPPFLDCDNERLYPKNCTNAYKDLITFNRNVPVARYPKCAAPLVATRDSLRWYPNIDGCGFQCQDPVYSDKQHQDISNIILGGFLLALLLSAFTIATFIIDWESCRKYTITGIFNLNVSLFFFSMGWMLQFLATKEHLTCRSSDNMTRYAEPGSGDSGWCVTSFVLIYYSAISTANWFAVISYAWYQSYNSYRRVESKKSTLQSKLIFGYAPWTVPAPLVLLILSISEVEADSLRGICFINTHNIPIFILFFVLPIGISTSIGLFFAFQDIRLLRKVLSFKLAKGDENSVKETSIGKDKARKKKEKIRSMILRLLIFTGSILFVILSTVTQQVQEVVNRSTWLRELDDSIVCSLQLNGIFKSRNNKFDDPLWPFEEDDQCSIDEDPQRISWVRIQLYSIFFFILCSSSWVWTKHAYYAWVRFITRKFDPAHRNEDKRSPRQAHHELNSVGFIRRHLNNIPSLLSLHRDPVGMNLTTALSQDISATWQAAIPNFIFRRGAIDLGQNATIEDLKKASLIKDHYIRNPKSTYSYKLIADQLCTDRSLDSKTSLHESYSSFNMLKDRIQRRKTRAERRKVAARSVSALENDQDVPNQHFVTPQDNSNVQPPPPYLSMFQIPAGFPPMLPGQGVPPPPLLAFSHLPPFSGGSPASYFPRPMSQFQRPPRIETPIDHPFTHGMATTSFASQTHRLTNPFSDRAVQHTVSPQVSGTGTSNLRVCSLNSQPPQPVPPPPMQHFPHYEMLMQSQAYALSSMMGLNPFAFTTPPPPLYGAALPTQPQAIPGMVLPTGVDDLSHRRPESVEAIRQGREKLAHLIRPVDSASELGDVNPNDIVISDTESLFSRRSALDHNPPAASELDEARELVEARIEKIAAEQPADAPCKDETDDDVTQDSNNP